MKELDLNQLENIVGGDTSDVITGACMAVGVAGALKLVAINPVVGGVIGGACIINTVGGYYDWW